MSVSDVFFFARLGISALDWDKVTKQQNEGEEPRVGRDEEKERETEN